MRAWALAALLATACDRSVPRAEGAAPAVTGVQAEDSTGAESTGDLPRLDLGPQEPWTTEAGGETTTTGGEANASTGDPMIPTSTGATSTGVTSAGSTGDGTSTGAAETTTGGEESSGGSSTGDPVTCGNGVCSAAEREGGCYQGPGWCFQDCWQAAECESDCLCSPEAAAVKNFCFADPLPACSATTPGGFCDPNGDGVTDDADGTAGFYAWAAKCG